MENSYVDCSSTVDATISLNPRPSLPALGPSASPRRPTGLRPPSVQPADTREFTINL